jgi:hypothetical protein
MTPLETLRALGTGSEAPSESKDRVRSALLAALTGASVATAAGAVLTKQLATLPPAKGALVAGLTGSKALALAAGIWLFGGVAGVALYGALWPQQVRVVYVDRAVPPFALPKPANEPEKAAPSVPSAAAVAAPSSAARHGSASAATSGSVRAPESELSRERALLDLARENAAHGEPALVLEQVERHRQQFPKGRLGEEREALAIRALLALGHTEQARARAELFHATYPSSFLTPVIEAALSAP